MGQFHGFGLVAELLGLMPRECLLLLSVCQGSSTGRHYGVAGHCRGRLAVLDDEAKDEQSK